MLEDEHRVGIRQRRGEHAVRVLEGCRRQDPQSRDVRVPPFEAVRVLRRELAAGAGGHPDHERNRALTARHVEQRRRVVEDLIEGEQAEVHRHDLDDRAHPAEGGADTGAHERRFRQRRVTDPLGPELLEQPLAHGEAAAVPADVLAHQEHSIICA